MTVHDRIRDLRDDAELWAVYDSLAQNAPPGRTRQDVFNVFVLTTLEDLADETEAQRHRPLLPPKIIAAATLVGTAAASFVSALFGFWRAT